MSLCICDIHSMSLIKFTLCLIHVKVLCFLAIVGREDCSPIIKLLLRLCHTVEIIKNLCCVCISRGARVRSHARLKWHALIIQRGVLLVGPIVRSVWIAAICFENALLSRLDPHVRYLLALLWRSAVFTELLVSVANLGAYLMGTMVVGLSTFAIPVHHLHLIEIVIC